MEPYRTETVETEAGEYTVELYPDYDAPNPLTDYDHEGMALYVWRRGRGDIFDSRDEAGRAGEVLREFMARHTEDGPVAYRYNKWKAITGSKWTLVTGSGYGSTQGDYWDWYVLADEQWADPVVAAKGTMDDYQKWAQGGYCGYVVKRPNGEHVDSLWAIDDEDYALSEAMETVRLDAVELVHAANLVGAGFVGLI